MESILLHHKKKPSCQLFQPGPMVDQGMKDDDERMNERELALSLRRDSLCSDLFEDHLKGIRARMIQAFVLTNIGYRDQQFGDSSSTTARWTGS